MVGMRDEDKTLRATYLEWTIAGRELNFYPKSSFVPINRTNEGICFILKFDLVILNFMKRI